MKCSLEELGIGTYENIITVTKVSLHELGGKKNGTS